MQRWLTGFVGSKAGLLAALLPGQLMFLTLALAAAALSPKPLRQRLRLGAGVMPIWTWVLYILATPAVGVLATMLLSSADAEPSEHLKMMDGMMRTHADQFLGGLLLLIAVLPGVAEELLFRGYLQSRLLERFPPRTAIAVSAFIFAAAHIDPTHAIGVLPLGLWLGLVAWRTGCVWPAILCHIANNAFAVVLTATQPAGAENLGFAGMMVFWISAPLLAVCILISLFSSSPKMETPR